MTGWGSEEKSYEMETDLYLSPKKRKAIEKRLLKEIKNSEAIK